MSPTILSRGEERWKARVEIGLGGEPVAFVFDKDGRLVVLVEDEPSCPVQGPPEDRHRYMLLRVGGAGTTEALE